MEIYLFCFYFSLKMEYYLISLKRIHYNYEDYDALSCSSSIQSYLYLI